LNIAISFGVEMMWLPDGEKKYEDVFNRFDRIPTCDRRTDLPTAYSALLYA